MRSFIELSKTIFSVTFKANLLKAFNVSGEKTT